MDDKTKTAPQDAQRVNVNEDYEVRYWCKKFGWAPDQLKDALRRAGVMAVAVEAVLKPARKHAGG